MREPCERKPSSTVLRKGGARKGSDLSNTIVRNKKAIEEYIKNQLQEDIAYDQISMRELINPFTGSYDYGKRNLFAVYTSNIRGDIMKRIMSIILIVVFLAGCSQKPKQIPQPAPEPTKPAAEQITEVVSPTPSVAEEKKSNLFDARKVKAGDKIAGLKVIKVEVHNASDEDYDAYVDFGGEVTVSGTFKHNLNDEFLDHEISFKVHEESAAKLPMLAHDQRYVWFMFMNHDEAEKALGAAGTEGKATVTIKNYSIKYAHTEIWNTADMVKVEKK